MFFKSSTQFAAFAITSVLAVTNLSSAAFANHKTNNPYYDFAARGGNYPGWNKLEVCKADRPGQGCTKIMNDCGIYKSTIYTTGSIRKALVNHLKAGETITINSMTKSGHKKEFMCNISY